MEGNTIMYTNSNTVNKNMSSSISMYSDVVMPYPSASETSFFEDSNMTDFLDQYRRIYINY